VFASAAAKPARDLHAASGWGGAGYIAPRAAAPFAVLDTVCTAMDAALAFRPDSAFGALTLFWSVKNTTENGDLTQGKIGGAFFSPSAPAIYLRGDAAVNTDEFDAMVIAHEFGHFVTHTLSRSDSIGGSHNLFDTLDPRLAFDEGWATAFAGLVLGTPVYRDSDEAMPLGAANREFFFNIQDHYPPGSGFPEGWYAEASMQRALYNFAAAGGGLGLGLDGLLQTFVNYRATPALAAIFSFGSQLKIDHAANAGGIAAILDGESINGDDIEPFAGTETHAPAAADLPVYRLLNVPGEGGAQTVCSSNTYGVPNKLSARRYIRFEPTATGRYRIAVQPVTAGAVAGLEVLDRGRYLGYQEATAANPAINFTPAQDLNYGSVYVLGIFHVGNAVADTSVPAGGNQCFKVSVTGL
jgi:hypothetical protein